MQLTVSGKQIDLSDALRVHVSQHMDNITNKYFDHALEANVTFSKARSFFTCDINLHAGRGVTVRGEGEAADAHAAFDDAAEHIAKRLRRYRKRVNDHARGAIARAKPEPGRQYILRDEDFTPEARAGADSADKPRNNGKATNGSARADGSGNSNGNGKAHAEAPAQAPANSSGDADDALHATIIAEADTVIETLCVRDAVMHMDLAYQPVLMFRNSRNGQLNVVYRRADGHIGWIDPSG